MNNEQINQYLKCLTSTDKIVKLFDGVDMKELQRVVETARKLNSTVQNTNRGQIRDVKINNVVSEDNVVSEGIMYNSDRVYTRSKYTKDDEELDDLNEFIKNRCNTKI
jgi:hypothetical protein